MSNAPARNRIGPNDVLRFLLELFALFSLGHWGYLAWPFPWPGALFMIATPLFAAVVWGLFRAPKARFPLDPVGRGIVEIAVFGAATIAWAMLGYPVIAVVFGGLALISGIINMRKENKRAVSEHVVDEHSDDKHSDDTHGKDNHSETTHGEYRNEVG